ncbi:MAG: GntR family transcriptional regulator, partial [Armatimonadetes bacterium]|nr:GntR family transcriptional regulator [Candidatus Hippobium faecium]
MVKYEFIKNKLFDEISILNDHNALPSRTQLTKKYNISEATVRRALQELVAQGVIYSIQGKGFFVSPKDMNFNGIFTFLHGIHFNITKEDTGLYP